VGHRAGAWGRQMPLRRASVGGQVKCPNRLEGGE
jgi:hypothetical protein